jgi:hypothetical protein
MSNERMREVLLDALACLYLNKQIGTQEYVSACKNVNDKYHD